MKTLLSLAAAAFLFVASNSAQAVTVDVTLGSTGSDILYGTGGTLTPNVAILSPAPANISLGFNAIISNTSNSFRTMPTGTLLGGNYLAILGDGGTGSALFTLSNDKNLFGFTWGTIDNYNTLTITDSRNVTYTLSGTNILSHIIGSIDGSTQADVIFHDPFGSIKTALFESTKDSFEVANFSESKTPVPLPASFPLFAAAMLALGYLGWRKRAARV